MIYHCERCGAHLDDLATQCGCDMPPTKAEIDRARIGHATPIMDAVIAERDRLAAEVDELRGKLADWEVAAQQGHPSPCTLGKLCPYCEIDRLRGKLDDVRMGIGCARGQRITQYCADLTQRDEVITRLLAMLKPGPEPVPPSAPSKQVDWDSWVSKHSYWLTKANCYNAAVAIAGRTE